MTRRGLVLSATARHRSQNVARVLYRDTTAPYRGATPARLRRLCAEIVAEGRRPSALAVFVADGDDALDILMAAGLPLPDDDDRVIAAIAIGTEAVDRRIRWLRGAPGESSRLLGLLMDGGDGEIPPLRDDIVRTWAASTAAEHVDAPWAMRLLAALAADTVPARTPPCVGGGEGEGGGEGHDQGMGQPRMDGHVATPRAKP